MGENLCQLSSDKGLVTRIYREIKKLTSQRINNTPNTWVNELNRRFSEEQGVNKPKKKCSTSLTIKEMQIKTTLIFTSPQSKWLSSTTQTATNHG
jgi:hypothetical protein